MSAQTFRINPLSSIAGAEIVGFNANGEIEDSDFDRVHQAFLDHSFIVIRDQQLTPENHIALTGRFGTPKGHILHQYLLPDHPMILVISNKKENGRPMGIEDAGRYWHTDVSYEDLPPMASMLYGLEVPPEGGDTLFASQYAAYNNLPQELKDNIANLRALHRFNYSQIQNNIGSARTPLTNEQEAQLTGAIHPVVRTHPETGRKALYVNPGFTVSIEGMTVEESDVLLAELFSYATDAAVIYCHNWKPLDLVLWDNRCLMHHATTYSSTHIRHMHRTTICGTRPH